MIGFSLALHVLALLFISGLRLPGKNGAAAGGVWGSLVTMPTPVSQEKPAVTRPVGSVVVQTPEPPVCTVRIKACPAPQPVCLSLIALPRV